jgi:hypothetical protein
VLQLCINHWLFHLAALQIKMKYLHFVDVVAGRQLLAGVTMDTGDRISQSLSAASDAISAAVSNGARSARYATQK